VDVADRGADPEADAVLTLAEMEHLIATWVVALFSDHRTYYRASELLLRVADMSATVAGHSNSGGSVT
jgi:hypothetical protein